jgi:hypothetical protein
MTLEEIRNLIRLGHIDLSSLDDRQAALNLLDGAGRNPFTDMEAPMTWDGKPEHRNFGGGDQPPKPLGDQRRDISARLGWQLQAPQPDPMPADPFDGLAAPAVAQVEMFHAAVDAGLTETQALYYVACLVQVGRAMDEGGMPDPPEEL